MTPDSDGKDPYYRTKLILCFATVYLVWGSTYLTTKIGVRELPPFLFGAVRFIVGGSLLFLVACLLNVRSGLINPKISVQEFKNLLIVGFCSVLLSNSSNAWGLQYVASNKAALLNVSASFWIPILGMFGRRAQILSSRVILALAIGFSGTLLIAWPNEVGTNSQIVSDHQQWLPTIVILIGCLGWAVATIYQRNVVTNLDLLSFTGLQMFLGGFMMLILGLIGGELSRWHWTPTGMAALAYMTLISSGIAYAAYAWLSVHTTPAQVSTYGFVNPAIATLLGWIALDERLSKAQIIGMFVILIAMLLMHWRNRSAA